MKITEPLFSDKHRFLKLLLSLLLILLLAYYGAVTGPDTEINFKEINTNPTQLNGTEISFAARLVDETADGAPQTLYDRGMYISATGLPSSIPAGEIVSGIARVRLDNQNTPYLKISEFHHHKYRYLKILTGPIVIGLLLVWFLKRYRFDHQKLVWKQR